MEYVVVAENVLQARELVAAAKSQAAEKIIAVMTSGEGASEVAACGVSEVVVAKLAPDALAEAAADLVADIVSATGEAVVLTGGTRRMVALAASVAWKLGTAPIVDVKSLSDGAAAHMAFGGKLLQTERATGPFEVVSLQTAAYEPASVGDSAMAPVKEVEVVAAPGAKVRERKPREAGSADLGTAKTVVCIGRGVNNADGFGKCVALKDVLGAEMGCTRPVTETENPLMPREAYIGASGAVCKPALYVGVAVSGQTQHTMGMYEAGRVVAIDKNPDAVFFQQVDYGIVGDYNEIVPAIVAALGA